MKLIRYQNTKPASYRAWDDFFDEVFRGFNRGVGFPAFAADSEAVYRPAAQVREDENNTYVRFELPGVSKDAISLEVNDGVLNVSGERKEKAEQGETAYRFSRSVTLADGTDLDAIQAKLEDGILTVTLPKPEAVKPRTISVE